MKKLFLIILLFCLKQMNAQVCFITTNYQTGANYNNAIACADFNNDGKLDLITAGGTSSIYLLEGDGLGSFGVPTIVNNDSIGSRCIVMGDFNNDGNTDLAAVGNTFGNNAYAYILFGNGVGGFSTKVVFPVGNNPFYICAADFNGDGKTDLATANNGSGDVSILLGDGAGNFNAHVDFPVGSNPNSLTSGDFNGDGKPDLAVTYFIGGTDSVFTLLGNGSGGFGGAISHLAGSGSNSVCSKDFNGDGFDDIAVANTNSNDVSVLISQGISGSFDPAHNYPAGNQPGSVISADFDSDGIPDLAIVDNYNNVSILPDSSNGMFGVPLIFNAYGGLSKIISADFNSDGRPDLAAVYQYFDSISVKLNMIAPNVILTSSTPATICLGTSATLTASGSSYYTWSSNAGVNNPNHTVTSALVTPLVSTTYTVVAGENACAVTASIFINVVTPEVPEICMVTTDSASNYNYIYWDKTAYTNVDSFIVYRKDAISLNYLRIGAVSKNSLSEFADTAFSIGGPNGGNPQYSSWIYKLAIRDTCGNIGAKSPYHQSMFFQKSGSNFSWNAYTVEAGQTNTVTGYSFLRDDNNTGNWHVLVNTTSLSATDPNFASFPNANWRIDALGFNCTAGRTQTFLKSKSNTSKLAVTSVNQLASNNAGIIVYPNPGRGSFSIETSRKEKQSIQVFDLNGRLLLSQIIGDNKNIDATFLDEGIYNLTIKTGDSIENKKLIIMK